MGTPQTRNPYNAWRKAVFARDGNACVQCRSTHRLQSDHIKPFSKFPELRYDVSNGRVLCFECHKKTDTYGAKLRKGQSLGPRHQDHYGAR